jgi:RimJ/RimL family protein N-acetyltransferase
MNMEGSRTISTKDGRRCTIRPVEEQDLEPLCDTVDSVAAEKIYIADEGIKDRKRFMDHLWDRVGSGDWTIMVAEVEGKIVGSVNLQLSALWKRRHTAYVGTLLVSGYRGQGIGTQMMRVAEAAAREKGVQKLQLSVFSSNTGAIRFYERHGFEQEAVLKRQFIIDGEPLDEVWMVKWL